MSFWIVVSPFIKYFQSLCHFNMVKSNSSLLHILSDFIVNKFIIETNIGSILSGISEDNSLCIWPINGSKTHWAWLTTCVNCAFFQVESTKILASISNCHHLSMCRWIVQWSDLVKAFTNNTIFLNNDATKRSTFFIFDSIKWKLDGSFQKYGVQLSLTFWVHLLLLWRIYYIKKFLI